MAHGHLGSVAALSTAPKLRGVLEPLECPASAFFSVDYYGIRLGAEALVQTEAGSSVCLRRKQSPRVADAGDVAEDHSPPPAWPLPVCSHSR